MKRIKKILFGLLLMAFATAFYGFYLYHKKPADVRLLDADYELTAAILLADYNKDEAAANVKYLDKVISIKGKIADVKLESATGKSTVILDSGDPMAAVICSFYNDESGYIQKLYPGEEIAIKGKCTGKLMDVVLNKCSIVK